MYRYIIKRLLLMIPIILAVTLIIFGIMAIIPGNPGRLILGFAGTEEEVQALNEKLGVNRPFFVRYLTYIRDAFLRLDLGNSYANGKAVLPEILSRLPNTAILAFCSVILALFIGVPIGVLSAVKQNSLVDTLPSAVALLLASLPTFVIGMVLMLIFALKLGWLPSGGAGSIKHFILPVISLGLPTAGMQLRFTRSSMLETIRQDYVRTARAKGAPEKDVIWKHAMKNALLPVITVAGNDFGGLLGGAVAIETLFGFTGLGSYVVSGIFSRDVPVVTGSLIVFTLMFSLVILIVDIAYAFIDPRIKAKYARRPGK